MQSTSTAQNIDTTQLSGPGHGLVKPILRNFITKRHEAFGGYLYNPYLLRPVAFSRPEMHIIDLLNGKNTTADIFQSLNTSVERHETVEKIVKATFEKLNGMFAVTLKKGASATHPPIHSINTGPHNPPPPGKDLLTAPLSVLWDVTYACNLRCHHCLSGSGEAHSGELTTHEAEQIIDELAQSKVFTITFCGGEPFLRKDFFHLLGYASDRNIGIKISTNGTLVSDGVIKRLDDLNVFAVQVSLDGKEESHNRLRNKVGVYRKAVNAIKRFVDAGYYTVVAPVVTRLNIQDIDAVIDTAAALGASAFKPSLFMPAGRGEKNLDKLALPNKDVKALIASLSQKQKAYEGALKIHLESKYPSSGKTTCAFQTDRFSTGDAPVGCSAGNTQIVITATGDVVACPFLYQFVAGNLRKDPLPEIWHSSAVLDGFRNMRQSDLKGRCRECGHVPEQCLGGCRAAAYLHSGDLYAEDPLCCAV